MKWIRGPINAILVATLVKPVARRMVARWRRRAREYAEATIVTPAQELLETALAPQLALAEPGVPPVDDELIDELAGRSAWRTLLIAGALALVTAAAVAAVVTVVRRRREAAAAQQENAKEPVAVPIEVPVEEAGRSVFAEEEPLTAGA